MISSLVCCDYMFVSVSNGRAGYFLSFDRPRPRHRPPPRPPFNHRVVITTTTTTAAVITTPLLWLFVGFDFPVSPLSRVNEWKISEFATRWRLEMYTYWRLVLFYDSLVPLLLFTVPILVIVCVVVWFLSVWLLCFVRYSVLSKFSVQELACIRVFMLSSLSSVTSETVIFRPYLNSSLTYM